MKDNLKDLYLIEDRRIFEGAFCEFMNKVNINFYGYFYTDKEKLKVFETDRGGFENEVYLINPYYWGEDEKIGEEPNFLYKPTGFAIWWYKYPLRASYMNINITLEEFREILDKCYKSYLKSVNSVCED